MMKVAIINGSPRSQSCTKVGLDEVANTLNKNGIETEYFAIGTKPIVGCIACLKCKETKRCVFNDMVNEFGSRIDEFDAFIFGSPVYYAAMSSSLKSFMDRLFYSQGFKMKHKPGAAVICSRRAGELSTFDQMNKYFSVHSMPIVTSQYWNNIHGSSPEDVALDKEGMQTMRTLATNMAWLLKCINSGKKQGIDYPQHEEQMCTNFIEQKQL